MDGYCVSDVGSASNFIQRNWAMGRRRGLEVQKHSHLSLIRIAHMHQDALVM